MAMSGDELRDEVARETSAVEMNGSHEQPASMPDEINNCLKSSERSSADVLPEVLLSEAGGSFPNKAK